jgi:hypothetical protein
VAGLRQGGKRALAVLGDPAAREALEVDLQLRGHHGGLDGLTLRRIAWLHTALCQDPHTLTAQLAGSDGYTLTEHLLFLAVDQLRTANWMRSKDGAKGRNRPKPLSPLAKPRGLRIGGTDRSPSEVMEVLARMAPARTTTA